MRKVEILSKIVPNNIGQPVQIDDIESKTYTLKEILERGKYFIPKFQRDYSWEIDHWEDLWQDLLALSEKEENTHYMGYLVLQKAETEGDIVIDGQQRLITLSIIIIVALKVLNEKTVEQNLFDDGANKKNVRLIHERLIGQINEKTKITINKLSLNRNNDTFYRRYIVPNLKMPGRDLKVSEKLLKKCYEFFEKAIRGKYQNTDALLNLINFFTEKMIFTVITVADQIKAYKVFETLNARGVKLSSSDLLKNYLFQTIDEGAGVHEIEINEMEEYWGSIIDKLEDEEFSEFLRVYWNSKNETTRKQKLFKTIRSTIINSEQAFELIRNLHLKVDIYKALSDPTDELWKGKGKISESLKLLQLFQVKQPIPLLLTAYEKLSESEFVKLLDACVVISIRYNIIGGLNPNEQENVYNKVALKVYKNKTFDINDLTDIYPDDDNFGFNFSIKEFKGTSRNMKIAKYILSKIEYQESQLAVNWSDESLVTIEHILPLNPANWDIKDSEHKKTVNRLGNLALLEKNLQKRTENYLFPVKREAYRESSYATTQKIETDNAKWDESRISGRQNGMANRAKTIWKINFS